MAKINPVKVKQDADKLEKAGKLEQAIALYRQIVEDSPRDWNTINKVGDLLAKLNKFQEANEEYAKVADFYAKDGFHLKAIAIWKKINKLDPSALGPYVNLAELYAKQGLMMEAKGQYQIVVEEYIKRGKMKDAGEVLRKMAEIDPADLKVRSKLADLYTREGQHARAVDEHVAIAEELSKKGHLTEAVQVLEKGLKIDARSVRLRLELGRVHIVQKNFERAVVALEEAAGLAPDDAQVTARLGEACLGAGRAAEAERLYRRLLERNPDDADARAQMGRVHLAQRRYDQALDEFAPLVERHVARREGDQAASLLQEIVQREPSHVKSLVKLAEVYRLLKQDNSVVATYSQLTEAYLQGAQYDQAIGVLETLVSMEPYNQQHKTKLQFVRDKRSAAGGAAAPSAPSGGELEEEFDLGIASEEDFPGLAESAPARRSVPPQSPTPLSVPALATAGARPRIELSGPLSEQDREFVDEHMAEGKVFRKYGLVDKAADQFEAVVARFPDNVEARQELRDIYKEKGQLPRAAEQARALAEVARLRGDKVGAERHEQEAQELHPAPVAAPAPAPAAVPPPPSRPSTPTPATTPVPVARPAAPPPPPPVPETEEIPLLLEETEGEEEISLGLESESEELPEHFLDDEEPSTPPAPATPTAEIDVELAFGEEAAAALADAEPAEAEVPLAFDGDAASPGGDADDESFEFPFEEEPDEPAPPPARPAAVPAAAPRAVAPSPAVPPPPAPSRPPSAPPARPAPAPAASGLPADVQRVLDEVDEYVALGFVDDARDALAELAQRHPTEAAVRAKMAELGLGAAPAAAAEPEAELAFDDGPSRGPDLADVLAPPARSFDAESLLGEIDLPAAVVEPEAPAVVLPAPMLADELEFPGLDEPPAATRPVAPEPDSIESMLADVGGLPVGGHHEDDEPDLDLPLDVEPPSFGGLPEPSLPEPEPPRPAAFEPEPEPESPLLGLGGPVSAVPADDGGGIDLGAELFGSFAAVESPEPAPPAEMGDASLADIFREFKKGVDRQLGQEDYDTRYNLGIAYKEMGLVDEAIAEFQLAAKDPGRLLECSSMLGICFLDKGLPKLAVKWFEKGLAAPRRSEEEYQGLRYDLACAYEADGDRDRARGLFAELFGQDAAFRDVAEKLRALSAR